MDETYNQKSQLFTTTSTESTVELIEELQKTNKELREARKAALNLMEDALLSKEALRQSEEKYRTKLEQDVLDRTGELKRSNDLLQATMDASPDMIQVFEAVRNEQAEIVDFRYILLNHEAERWMPEAIGKTLLQLQPGVVEEGIFDAFKKVVETGVPQQYEKHYVHEQFNGWYYQSVVKLNDGVATTTSNITGRKTAELAVHQSKTLLQDIINAPRIGMAVYKAIRNKEGEIVDFVHEYINQASLEMLGGEDFTGRLFTDHGENAVVQLPQFIEVIQSGKANGYTREALLHGQNFWFAITNTPLGADRLLHTWEDVTERKQAEAEILHLKDEIAEQAEDKYRTLFTTIDEAFALIEVICDEQGNTVDLLWLETNAAFERHTGFIGTGKKMSEVTGDVEPFWYQLYDRVLQTGEPQRVEYTVDKSGKWYRAYLSLVGSMGSRHVALVFDDITERKRREFNLAFLADISHDLTTLTGSEETMKQLGKKIGQYFGVQWCMFSELIKDNEFAVAAYGWNEEQVPSLMGTYHMRDYLTGEQLAKNNAGEITICYDTQTDPNIDAEAYGALGVRSFINVPLSRNGQWQFLQHIMDNKPRQWQPDEIALLREIAVRIWARLEKARAEEALQKSEEKYRTLFNSIDEGFVEMEMIMGDAGQVADWRWLAFNPAFERMSGLKGVVGKLFSEIVPELEPEWAERYGHVVATGEALRFELPVGGLDSWFDIFVSRIGGEGSRRVAVVFNNVSERKHREANLAFLAEVSQELVRMTGPQEMLEILGAKISTHFKSIRTSFVEIFENENKAIVREWHRPEHSGIAGEYPLSQFLGEAYRQRSRSGETIVIPDIHKTSLVNGQQLEEVFGIKSLINIPLIRNGQWVFTLGIHDAMPRNWRDDEIELLQELTARLWARLERARAEEALIISEARFRTIAEAAPALVWVCSSPDGANIFFSEKWYEFTGQTHEEAKGYGWTDAVHPEDWLRIAPYWERCQQTGEIYEGETRYRRYDGEWRWFNFRALPLYNSSGIIESWYGISIEIHDKKLAEEALRTSEERFRTLANAVPQVIWSNNEEGVPNYFNGRWYDYSGLTYEQSLARGWEAIVHPEDAAASKEKWRRALAKGEVFDTEYRLRRHDGTYRWYIGRNVPLLDNGGKVRGWFGSATDIEDLKRTTEALSQSEARMRITMESATDYAIITMDTERKIERWSSGAAHIFGYTEAEMIRQSADLIFTTEDRAAGAPQTEMETARDTGRAADERWHQRKDGSRFYASGVMRPIQNNHLTGYVKVLRDMTQQQLFTEELGRLVAERTAELQRSNEDLRQFAHVASHDLKEPVRKIKTFNSRVLDEFENEIPAKAKNYLQKIDVSTDRMLSMIDGVLRYSKLGNTELLLQQVNLNETILQMQTDLEVLIQQKKAKITAKALPILYGSGVLMYQLFYNLILNSLKFAKAGVPARINIDCERTTIDEKDFYAVVLSDNGIGFEPEFEETIFKTFTRLNPSEEYEGTGLGLALCKKIVERHGGVISASGKPGEGAIFRILLPIQ